MHLALIVLLPFLGALLPPLMIRAGRDTCALVTGSVTVAALALLLTNGPAVLRGQLVEARIPWVPQIGLDLAFFVDGYGLFFAGLILIIGLLIIIYAR
jgi:multicomponent K+:H+ antiporter subunit A